MKALTTLLEGAFGRRGRATANEPELPAELDPGDVEIYRYVMENKLTMVGRERLLSTLFACKHVVAAGVAGDFVECGVWRGGNAIVAADVFQRHDAGRKVWLYDTFAGMTRPTEADVNWLGKRAEGRFERNRREGYNQWNYASLEDVKANFERAPRRSANTVFQQGDVIEVLAAPERLPSAIAVLRLDTDWYESTRAELAALYPRLSAGGVLIIDDYGHWEGQRRAVDEYFEAVERPFFHYADYASRVGVKPR